MDAKSQPQHIYQLKTKERHRNTETVAEEQLGRSSRRDKYNNGLSGNTTTDIVEIEQCTFKKYNAL